MAIRKPPLNGNKNAIRKLGAHNKDSISISSTAQQETTSRRHKKKHILVSLEWQYINTPECNKNENRKLGVPNKD